jgi:hypothetical protein
MSLFLHLIFHFSYCTGFVSLVLLNLSRCDIYDNGCENISGGDKHLMISVSFSLSLACTRDAKVIMHALFFFGGGGDMIIKCSTFKL